MKKRLMFILVLSFIFVVLTQVSAIEQSVCCERTNTGAWCQNAPQGSCDENFRSTPASCEATSFCKLGTCYDSQEGTCLANTPQKVCQDNGGVWDEKSPDEIAQCQLGCCVLGDQASFTTLTRCKRLSNIYGLENDFQTSIKNEVQCIASVASETKGACVYEKDFENTCTFTSRKNCMEIANSNFYENKLCTDESLGTNCAPTQQTTCVPGRDEVYYMDSCGNVANIYDSTKLNDKTYWGNVFSKDESCNPDSGNPNSASCGNCDYFLGSVCSAYNRGETARPSVGNYICKDLSCNYNGQTFQHGETWCADTSGTTDIFFGGENRVNIFTENTPGSKYARAVCYNGEVTVESCSDFRQEVCMQTEVNNFKNAACIVNKWQDCYGQVKQKDCENTDKRDCTWLPGVELNAVAQATGGSKYDTVPAFRGSQPQQTSSGSVESTTEKDDGACIPKYNPGFNFWEAGDGESICAMANTQCVVKFEKGILGGEPKCVKNCECLDEAWEQKMNNMCIRMGDCGDKNNYLGYAGYGEGTSITITKLKNEK